MRVDKMQVKTCLNFPVCSNNLSAEGGGCLAPRMPGIAQSQAGEHSIPGHSCSTPSLGIPAPPCVTKQAVLRGRCVFSALSREVPGAVQSHGGLSLGVLESRAASLPRCVPGLGLATGSTCSHSPFSMQVMLSTTLLSKALVQTVLSYSYVLQLGRGLG